MAPRLPSSVLFACTTNVVRSPMAEAILKSLHGSRIYIDSAGTHAGEPDPFAAAVMREIGLPLEQHRPKSLDDLDGIAFDLVIALSPQAHACVSALTQATAVDLEDWSISDPTAVWGTRDQRLVAYRAVRDDLVRRIRERFPTPVAAPPRR